MIRPAVAVDKYQTVAFDSNRYSVPRRFAFQMVTVKGYVDRVVIVAKGQVVATHERSLAKQTMILDPLHYLATLGRKPGALDHAPVFRDWKLPACFADFRAELERLHGAMAGSRRFVRVLQLLGEHPMSRVSQAIEACRRDQLHSAEAVIQRTRSLAAIEAAKRDAEVAFRSARRASSRRPAPRSEPLRSAPERPRRREPRQRLLRLIDLIPSIAYGKGMCRWPMSRTSCSRPSCGSCACRRWAASSRSWRGTPPRAIKPSPSSCSG